ncbi:hypothetical protein BX616_001536, partial [Lobosporangium transversale]
MFSRKETASPSVHIQEKISSRDRYETLENIDPIAKPSLASIETVNPCQFVQRRYFGSDSIDITKPRTAVTVAITGQKANPGTVAQLPARSSKFELSADFGAYSVGRYIIRWRVKALEDYHILDDLHFIIEVKYDAEEDVSGTTDVLMPSRQLDLLARNDRPWHNLELEERLVILPHVGAAHVRLVLCSRETNQRVEYSGLAFEHVEIRPETMEDTQQSVDIPQLIIRRLATPRFVIDSLDAHPPMSNSAANSSQAVITRLAASKGGCFLATLALSHNTAFLTVWDVNVARFRSSTLAKTATMSENGFATAVIQLNGIGDLSNLSIGLAISNNGDQIAIYQEPKIGEWAYGSTVQKGIFPFKLFNNPLVQQAASVTVNMGQTAEGDEENLYNKEIILAEDGTPISQPLSFKSIDDPNSASRTMCLEEVAVDRGYLSEFIGYCAFLPETKQGDWERNDLNSTLLSYPEGEYGSGCEECDKEAAMQPPSSTFLACDGLYMDVFEITPQKNWKRMHTITLTDLAPTLSRRITCKMMMETVTSNTFMWLEDGGVSCSIWNSMTGANICYICSHENARFKGDTFRGHCKMAISPHESIVALASVDGSLTTYFATTGMTISKRTFQGYKIEYVGFHAQDDQVIVILRNSITSELSPRILDSLNLKYETFTNDIPIPTIGTAILAFFNAKKFWRKGMVCEADGTKINCYVAHQPSKPKFNKNGKNVIKAELAAMNTTSFDNVNYQLKTGYHREFLPEGDGAQYWVLRVEVVEADTQKTVFSFVPEPWMRELTKKVVDPENSIKAYFIAEGTRFAVVGKQTLQIWSLPFGKSNCSLQFIWSQPLDVDSNDSTNVKDYYADITSTSVYWDNQEGQDSNSVAEIKTENSRRRLVPLPGANSDARLAILYCFRSIHLIAAAYVHSITQAAKLEVDPQQVNFTYKDHADALIKFTHEHINRMISIKVFSVSRGQNNNVPDQNKAGYGFSVRKKADRNANNQPEVVTILTLLMDCRRLRHTNHIFVEGLLATDNGEWIPRDNKALNPIKRAIEARNGPLVEAFIEYCIKSAKKFHPAYMTPAVQCLNELSDRYPNHLADMFRRASYVPAHNHAYVATHAIVANRRYADWVNFFLNYYSFKLVRKVWIQKSHNINDYSKPVFSLRSQLPFRAINKDAFMSIETSILDNRMDQFPAKREEIDEEQRRAQSPYSHKIYVCPFPRLSRYPAFRGWVDDRSIAFTSAFTDIAGQEFFDSPAMVATLEFKWHKYAFFNWFVRYLITLAFFLFFLLITGMQIKTSTLPDKEKDPPITEEWVLARYLLGWRPFIKFTIFVGLLLLIYDLQRLMVSASKYIRSPFNFWHLFSHIFTITGCFLFLNTGPGKRNDSSEDSGPSGNNEEQGPSLIWVMSFAILALYMNMLFELRVIRQLGIVVNIILNITRQILWFFVIFAIFIVSFTHALLHLQHTRRFRRDCYESEKGCEDQDYPDGYPKRFLTAMSATYFFL